MPARKKNTLTTEAWPAMRRSQVYEALIKNTVPDKGAGFLQVTLENRDPSQSGRIHTTKVPLPLRPGNRACAFLAACGIDATPVGTTVDLDQIAGAVVALRFQGLSPDGTEDFDFERVSPAPIGAKEIPTTTEKEVRSTKRD